MKQTAINQAILMVRNRIDSIDETLMGKHTAHHLQQVERILYNLIEDEKTQIINAYDEGICEGFDYGYHNDKPKEESGEEYYKKNYEKK
jgi:hypothetical protein